MLIGIMASIIIDTIDVGSVGAMAPRVGASAMGYE